MVILLRVFGDNELYRDGIQRTHVGGLITRQGKGESIR